MPLHFKFLNKLKTKRNAKRRVQQWNLKQKPFTNHQHTPVVFSIEL